MRPIIDWKECIKDSPSFRASLEDAEEDMDLLEIHLEKLLKQSDWMQETGKVFNNANSAFISSLREIMTHFNDDCLVLEALGKFCQTLSEWQSFHSVRWHYATQDEMSEVVSHYHRHRQVWASNLSKVTTQWLEIMLEQCNRCFSQNINNFIKTDIRKVKESRKQFRKLADEMDSALYRSAQVPRSKPDDCEEVSSHLESTRINFTRASLQHVLEINLMQIRKRLDLLNAMLSYVQTQSKFVRQGYELFTNLEPYSRKLTSEMDELQKTTSAERKRMTDRHKSLLSGVGTSSDYSPHIAGGGNQANHPSVASSSSSLSDIRMEGYLFKRTSNAFKTWVRRWFVVENNQLLYCSQQRSKESMTVLEKDLRLCNVKMCYDIDRRFCFQVTSPLRSHILQADSDADCCRWISAIQEGAAKAYSKPSNPVSADPPREEISRRFSVPAIPTTASKEQTPVPPTQSRHVLRILSVEGNGACCDCGLRDPRWASINLGITLCIECSGIHRSFGVHKSKVRSLTLDAWEDDHVKLMETLGNRVVNQIFEAAVDESVIQRAQPNCNRAIREAWITAKYLHKSFVQPMSSSCPLRLDVPPDGTNRSGRNAPSVLGSSPSFADVHHLSCGPTSAMKQVASQDSGLGGSNDVIQCASNASDQSSSLGLEDTHSAISDLDVDAEILSLAPSTHDASITCANNLLCKAAFAGSIPEMLRALGLGASPNWNCKAEDGKTPLIRAIESGNVVAMEFLLLNGAKTDIADDFGRTPLHHATILRQTTHVYQLIRRNANQHVKDSSGQDALDIAVQNMDANIVTLLRLARLNDEMKESDALYDIQDEMFSEVFKDFGKLKTSPDGYEEDKL